jgi:hypothetical protein
VPALVAVFRSVDDDAVTAIQRVALTAEGAKIGRRMLGIVHRAAVKLDQASDPLHVGEGIETMMAARQLGLAPAWALGSAGMVAHPRSPASATCASAASATSERARRRACTRRWQAAGRQVQVAPTIGKTSTTSCNMEIINPAPDDDGGEAQAERERASAERRADLDGAWLTMHPQWRQEVEAAAGAGQRPIGVRAVWPDAIAYDDAVRADANATAPGRERPLRPLTDVDGIMQDQLQHLGLKRIGKDTVRRPSTSAPASAVSTQCVIIWMVSLGWWPRMANLLPILRRRAGTIRRSHRRHTPRVHGGAHL